MPYLGTPYLGHCWFYRAKCLNVFCDEIYKSNPAPTRVCFSLDNLYNAERETVSMGAHKSFSEEDFMHVL